MSRLESMSPSLSHRDDRLRSRWSPTQRWTSAWWRGGGLGWWQPKFVVALAFMMTLSLSYLALASAVASTGYDLANLQVESSRLRRENAQTRVEIDRLRSLERVARVAGHLGMGPPRKIVFVVATETNPGYPVAVRHSEGNSAPSFLGGLVGALRALLDRAGPG